MESKHSSLPWIKDGEFIYGGSPQQIRIADTTIADDDEQYTTPEQAEANADLIVRAVNQHESLVAIALAAQEIMTLADYPPSGYAMEFRALSKAMNEYHLLLNAKKGAV